MKTYWSNCLIEALRRKLRHPRQTKLKVLRVGLVGFHVFWHDRKANVVQHFTHKLVGRPAFKGSLVLFFRGVVETLSVERFNKYCTTCGWYDLVIA